jgi:hypothetical protein
MTYGEALVRNRNNLNFKYTINRLSKGIRANLPPKMERNKRLRYYNDKVKVCFEKKEK